MTFLSFVFILTSLLTFVAGQLFLKRAMESTTKGAMVTRGLLRSLEPASF